MRGKSAFSFFKQGFANTVLPWSILAQRGSRGSIYLFLSSGVLHRGLMQTRERRSRVPRSIYFHPHGLGGEGFKKSRAESAKGADAREMALRLYPLRAHFSARRSFTKFLLRHVLPAASPPPRPLLSLHFLPPSICTPPSPPPPTSHLRRLARHLRQNRGQWRAGEMEGLSTMYCRLAPHR